MRSLTREQVRAVDLQAIGDYSLPGIVLMENAGRNAAHLLMAVASLDRVNPPLRVSIACGRGNNGGDGFVIARHLENLGAEVKLLLACDPSAYRGDAAINHAVAVRAGIPIEPLESAPMEAWSAALAGSDRRRPPRHRLERRPARRGGDGDPGDQSGSPSARLGLPGWQDLRR